MVLLCVAGLGTPAQASATDPAEDKGSFGISLLDVTPSHRSDPRALTKIVDHLTPGTVIKRRVLLISELHQRRVIEIYPGAAAIGNGKLRVGEGHATNELTSWISLDHDRVGMSPGDKTPVEVTIRVPSTATTGERYAMVWASLSSRDNASPGGSQIDAVNRVGIRIYLHVGPGDEPPSDFTIGTMVPALDDKGEPTVTVEVTNTGGRALDITGEMSLSDGPDDTRAGPFSFDTTTLAPGEPGKVTASLPADLADGPWKVRVSLTSGTVKHSAAGTITFPRAGEPGQPSRLSGVSTNWPTVGGALAAASTVVLTGLVWVARRSRRMSAAAPRQAR
ncbi:hypothetical protein ACH4T9_14865 [Micromonospora sp. NPDC020750]|uniref:hypothetical protein n=1 Tax=unclassified Micromonospora TaxID=2617518 RepID=UPI0037BD14C0